VIGVSHSWGLVGELTRAARHRDREEVALAEASALSRVHMAIDLT